MQEEWTRWKPIPGLAADYYIESVIDTIDKFEIKLSSSQEGVKGLLITFEGSIHAYRNTEERYRLLTFKELSEKYDVDFYANWTLFKIINSSYLQWLLEQSHGISECFKLQHFCIFTSDFILDIADPSEPTVKFVDESTSLAH